MPMPNFHACRLRDSGRFQDGSIRTFERKHDGKPYSVLAGRLKGEETLTDQSYRYPRETWTESQAREHCKDHDGKEFEPATGEKEANKAYVPTLINRPWLIDSGRLHEMLAATEAPGMFDFDDLFREKQKHEVRGNIGILPVTGVLTQKASLLQKIFGGTSTDQLAAEFISLRDNPDVEKIVLDIDSPGGEVDGIQPLADAIFAARDEKPIIALVNSCACSAAYWIASAASKIVMSSKTAIAGSVGVVAIHRDFSEAEKKAGIKTTEIVAGKFKRIASQHEPLSAEGKETLQAQVDYIYALFVAAIAKHRAASEERVISDMAEGRVFIGQQAVNSGLADGIESLEDFFSEGDNMPEQEKIVLSEEYMAKESPQLLEKIRADAHKTGFEAGVKSERDRVKALNNMAIEGFDDIVTKAIEEGKTAEATSMELIAAVKNRGITPASIKGDNQQVDHAATDAGAGEMDAEQQKAMIERMAAAANKAVNSTDGDRS